MPARRFRFHWHANHTVPHPPQRYAATGIGAQCPGRQDGNMTLTATTAQVPRGFEVRAAGVQPSAFFSLLRKKKKPRSVVAIPCSGPR